jgi:hypothetical protein
MRTAITQGIKKRLLAAAFLLLLLASPFPYNVAETTVQSLHSLSVRRYYRHWPAMNTAFFHLRYPPQEEEMALWIGREADTAAIQVMELLPFEIPARLPWLVVVPHQDTLRQAFGWNEGTGALGVYLAGTVKILRPEAWDWVEEDNRYDVFQKQGPLVHEFTHYVLDIRTGGNYTRWFSEGMSQLAEFHILGYEWLESCSSLANPLYSLDELDESFDALPIQALAYRQALSKVAFLEALQGFDGLNRFVDTLGQGVPFYEALEHIYGMNREEFLARWQDWYRQDARWFKAK